MVEVFKKAVDLPPEWDIAAGCNYALHRHNLMLLEEVNPCCQTYVVFKNQEAFSIIVHYQLELNIFSYSRLRLEWPVTVVGVPYSVCEPGYSIQSNNIGEVNKYISSLKGAKIILNADDSLCMPGFTKGYTLPSCVMKINWSSFDEYLDNLRSHYRYRYKKALKNAKALSVGVLKDGFNKSHYNLYEQVYNKSLYKLEKLPVEYFCKSEGTIIEFKLEGEPVAFVQYTIVDRVMVFLFGGLNYELNIEYDLYLNMLLCLVSKAIENNCSHLNLGQTAEEIKCRLGAFQEKKYIYIHHSNQILNRIAHLFKSSFSYRMKEIELQVLKR